MKTFKKRNLFFAALIVVSVALLYGMLAFANIRTPMVVCKDGVGELDSHLPSMSLLAGEWLRYPGAPAADALDGLEGIPVDAMHIGIMEGSTYRIRLHADSLQALCFMLPRSRGSQVWLDGNAVVVLKQGI